MGFFKARNKKVERVVVLEEIKTPWVNKKTLEDGDNNFINRKSLSFNDIDNVIKDDDKIEKKVEQLIEYSEYLAKSLNDSIEYSEYLAKQLDIIKRKV